MYKSISFYAAFGNRTGYQHHATGLADALEKLMPVYRNQPGGDISISLLDTVTASQITTFPPNPSILLNVWEASEQPAGFIENLRHYSQFWVASEAQRAWSIAQGLPEEFVFTVPEGVDPEIFKPLEGDPPKSDTFDFLVCGQWQRRKSTLEIVQAFLKAFPDNSEVRLYLSVDTIFPSDPYKSTEERLEKNGISDERIIPVHFEEREEYVRRLQTCHVYAQCSRSEGFGRPGIEAMACGAVSIMEDWGGSTEYSSGALLVRVPKLEKPKEIYGNWEVPGMWGSPDYGHLVEVMRDAYENYSMHKKKALITSKEIRTKFSWEAAAKKAYDIIQAIPESAVSSEVKIPVVEPAVCLNPEAEIRIFARARGYEVRDLKRRKSIFTVDTHPDSPEKLECLVETIKQIKELGYPILVTSHFPLPLNVIEMIDFHIYDKRDILSGEDRPIYSRTIGDGHVETTKAGLQCHALASTMNVRNGIDFCLGKYDWIYHMSYDTEVDIKDWMEKVNASDKSLIGCRWDHQEKTFSGQVFAGTVEVMDKIVPRLETWEEFAKMHGERRFNSEEVFLDRINEHVGVGNYDVLDIDLGNRFDQVDREAWKDDLFQCHFVEGPFFNIIGISNREYDVTFSNPIDGESFVLKQKVGSWSRPDKKYFREWTITAKLNGEVKFQHNLDLKGNRVLISLGSKALGDTIAWIPYIEEFRKKHDCHVIFSSWWKKIFDYPEIEFVNPGTPVENVCASYDVGCFDDQLDRNVINWRLSNLQKVAADILGVDYKPIRAKMKYESHRKGGNGNEPKPYVCFSEFSTMQNKLWNREGAWQKIIDYLNSLGYDCVSISTEQSKLTGIIDHCGQSIEQSLTDVSGASFYVGLNAGPTWLAYALNIPHVMIVGVSEPWNDPPNPYRVQMDVGCKPCFNNVLVPINRGWEWCVNEDKYACTKAITPEMVIKAIDTLIKKEVTHAIAKRKIGQSGGRKHKRVDAHREISPAPSNCDSHV